MRAVLATVALALLGGCAGSPPSPDVERASANDAAGVALKQVGRRYRAGGASPAAGFDCSGLVHYSYGKAGVSVPRSTDRQRATGRVVKVAELRRGDLLFFNQEGKKFGHVGIYLGGGRFVHAPSSGKTVRSDSLDSPYWKKHLTEARRLAA